MDTFAAAVDRQLANQLISPNQIATRASNDLAARGIRQPGGLLTSAAEKFTLEAFQTIFDLATEEQLRRKDSGQPVAKEEVSSYLSAKFQPLRDYAASLASGRQSSFKSIANAHADKLIQAAG